VALKDERSPKESANEVWTLVRDYAKQETLDPIKGLLNFAKWGLVGSLLVAIGVIELLVTVLRMVQVETGIVLLLTKRAMTSRKAVTEP
jgi:hypothetical protein